MAAETIRREERAASADDAPPSPERLARASATSPTGRVPIRRREPERTARSRGELSSRYPAHDALVTAVVLVDHDLGEPSFGEELRHTLSLTGSHLHGEHPPSAQ